MDVLHHKPLDVRLFTAVSAAALCLGFCSCELILRLQPLEITDWHPREARITASAVDSIWVTFSSSVDAAKAEQAFSLSENGTPMTGSYSWHANRLVFTPVQPVSPGNDYEIAVVSTVETEAGNSLSKDFRFAFTTKTEAGRPTVLAAQPADGSRVTIPLLPIVVTFSEPVDQASFLAAFSVSPDPGGTMSFDTSGATASFTPLSIWQPGTEYTVVISDTLKDLSGNRLPEAVRFRFTAGADDVRPMLLAVRPTVNGTPQGAGLAPEDPTDSDLEVNVGFETTWGIELQFSRTVSRENIESFIDLQPAWSFQIDPAGAPRDRFILVPQERLVWGSMYALTIKRGVLDTSGNATAADVVYHIRAEGPATRPPKVEVVRFLTNPGGSSPVYA
ncbi:MAG TPA: Ig-like domain-containing protein, partial [Spirochaetia bacterium]|nr:Ig-like domain-containing protein [Spirochaetia bacterium]